MQTFLPFADFEKSVKVLHNKHLNGQRNEASQLLLANLGVDVVGPAMDVVVREWRYRHHTVARQWRGYEHALYRYLLAVMREGQSRGMFAESDATERAWTAMTARSKFRLYNDPDMPAWFGDTRFHDSHKSNLLRKDAAHYGQFFDLPDDLPYFYPHGLAKQPGPYFNHAEGF